MNTAADSIQQSFSFIPLVGEPTGGWGPSAQCLFKQLLAGSKQQSSAVAKAGGAHVVAQCRASEALSL